MIIILVVLSVITLNLLYAVKLPGFHFIKLNLYPLTNRQTCLKPSECQISEHVFILSLYSSVGFL